MIERLYTTATFVAYQVSIVLGIALLPVALAARRAGISLPVGRLVERTSEAYARAR